MSTAVGVDLERIAEEYGQARRGLARRITICAGTGCVANGALKVFDAFVEQIAAAGLDVLTELRAEVGEPVAARKTLVSSSGCQGFCQMGPLVTIEPQGILKKKKLFKKIMENKKK